MEWFDDVLNKMHWKNERRGVHFKEGDIVRIRQWDDMEEEFGTFKLTGSIACQHSFTYEMKNLCGREAELLTTVTGRGNVKLRFLDGTSTGMWAFSTDMIEPVEGKEEIIDVEPEELQSVTQESEDISKLIEELGGLF